MTSTNRTRESSSLGILGAVCAVCGAVALFYVLCAHQPTRISDRSIRAAQAIAGLEFTSAERKLMRKNLEDNLEAYKTLRRIPLPNAVPPALAFSPVLPGMTFAGQRRPFPPLKDRGIKRPASPDELAFYSVADLAELIRTRQITSVELTRLYLERLKTYGPRLHCVVTLTEDLALRQARRADEEIAAGRSRGPLHGIPWGAKDLLAVKGIRTTWGAAPFKDQVFDEDAEVVRRMEKAGAVLVAKLSMGELAWGDVWFGGKTRNPWNLEAGSSGSSAGSASATAAGLVGFAIGTETWGSIVSPSTRCGTTGLRPTYGRVSRAGAMALSWSMDKIGPICRTAEDCALVFNAILGPDGQDLTVVDLPFNWDPEPDLKAVRVGYFKPAFDKEDKGIENDRRVLDVLRAQGVSLTALELPTFPVGSLSFILDCEAAAAFDELTRSNRDSLLVRQGANAWPNVFRQARSIPAVEYIQANRLRTLLMRAMDEAMKDVDVFITPSYGGDVLLLTNLTGHPAVVVPDGFDDKGSPTSISFIGNLFDEAKTLGVAKAFQEATDFHLRHPRLEGKPSAAEKK